MLITGGPGRGKSQMLKRTIQKCIEEGQNVLFSALTGLMAARFKNEFQAHIHTDTVHSAFTFPVDQNERANINWIISAFDIVIIDEISMITKRLFEHIRTLNEIPVRPVVLIGGDEQQQLIDNIDRKTTIVSSILDEGYFFPLCKHFKLTSQHRILDPEYEKFLKHIRHWQPTQNLLDYPGWERCVLTLFPAMTKSLMSFYKTHSQLFLLFQDVLLIE